jgi:hypothetical protein
MDLLKIISELKRERDLLDDAILQFQHLAVGRSGKRRGRPPKWLQEAESQERDESNAREQDQTRAEGGNGAVVR